MGGCAHARECVVSVVQCAAQEVAPMSSPYGIVGLIVAILVILLLLRLLGVI